MKNWFLRILILALFGPATALAETVPGVSVGHVARPLQLDSALLRTNYLVGMNVSTFGGGDARLHLAGDKVDHEIYWKGQMGLRSAVLLEWNLGLGVWTLETGLEYQVAGAYTGQVHYSEEVEEGVRTHFINTKAELHYLGVPLLMKYYTRASRGNGLYLKAGVTPAFLVQKKFDVPNPKSVLGMDSGVRGEGSGDSMPAAPVDLQLTLGAGLNFQVDSQWSIVIEGTLGHGLLSIDPAYHKSMFNQSIGLVFGFSYHL